MEAFPNISPGVLAALGALIAVQLGLQVAALIVLSRTPAERITLGGRKVVWVLIIVLGEILGPIAFFAAGRTAAPVDVAAMPVSAERGRDTVDLLYGETDARGTSSDSAQR